MTVIQVADALRKASKQASDLLETLENELLEMQVAVNNIRLGKSADGVPFATVVADLKKAEATNNDLRNRFKEIRNMCDAPHFSSTRRWAIRDLAAKAEKS